VSKTRWGPEETVYWEALQLGPGLRGRLFVPLAQSLSGQYRRIARLTARKQAPKPRETAPRVGAVSSLGDP
jgi:hypothetical protein